jgi:hypothetical protein
MQWLIDGRINLSAICADASWHRGTILDSLRGYGLPPDDAEAYTAFACAEYATEHGGTADMRPQEYLSDSQWERLSLNK